MLFYKLYKLNEMNNSTIIYEKGFNYTKANYWQKFPVFKKDMLVTSIELVSFIPKEVKAKLLSIMLMFN